ncbi:MAG: hypothetical protein QXL15_04240 [Candidatus Korarchaeota archaeon]
MSFMIDWILLIICGGFAAWLAKRKIFYAPQSFFLQGICAAILILFYGISIPLFLDLQSFPLVPAFLSIINITMGTNYTSGTDFMMNFPLRMWDVSHNVPPYNDPILLLVGMVLFLTYPLYLYLGAGIGKVLFGEKPDDKGAIDLVL